MKYRHDSDSCSEKTFTTGLRETIANIVYISGLFRTLRQVELLLFSFNLSRSSSILGSFAHLGSPCVLACKVFPTSWLSFMVGDIVHVSSLTLTRGLAHKGSSPPALFATHAIDPHPELVVVGMAPSREIRHGRTETNPSATR